MDEVGRYVDSLTMGDKLRRMCWTLFAFVLFKPFGGPFLKEYRSLVLRLWGACIGRHCAIASGARIWAPWNLVVDDYVAIARGAEIYNVAPIRIGHHVTISQGAYVCTASHDISKKLKPLVYKPITIDAFAWVCARAMVMPGVVVSEGAVIAAGAVVVKDVAAWTVVGGNPAKFIKARELA